MSTTTPTTNIFANAKKVEKAPAKKDKQIVLIPSLEGKVGKFNTLKGEIESLEAQKKMLEGDIKSIAQTEWCRTFEAEKVRPESFVIQDNEGNKVLFMATDKYSTVTEEKAKLMETICPELIETETVYGFDNEVLSRNIEAISNAILGAQISDEDKANLITCVEKTTVKKGAIERLGQHPDRIESIFGLISPVCMLKPQR